MLYICSCNNTCLTLNNNHSLTHYKQWVNNFTKTNNYHLLHIIECKKDHNIFWWESSYWLTWDRHKYVVGLNQLIGNPLPLLIKTGSPTAIEMSANNKKTSTQKAHTLSQKWVRVMVFNTTFNNISFISWRSVVLVEETGVPGENYSWPAASHWQTLSHNVV